LTAPSPDASAPALPLAGLLVLDTSEAMAGPYCSMLLGDLGADVVKVERPGIGDQSRTWGPPFLHGESAYFLSVNRNKRSIELDIKNPADLDILHRLARAADVFITNNPRMASLERAQIDPGTLTGMNAGLVYLAISGYGHTGPKANRSGYDIIAQGEAGLMALTGAEIDGEPSRFPTPMADISTGIYATIGVLAALYRRDAGSGAHAGRGQFLDVALLDVQTTWLANLAGSYFASGERPQRLGNVHPTVTPYQPLKARDRYLMIAAGTQRLWERLCRVLGVTNTLFADPRFATNAQRNLNRDALVVALEQVLAGRDAALWIEALAAEGIPAGPINFPDDALSDPQILARGMIVELEHPLLGMVRSLGLPVRFADGGLSYRRPPPLLGEHNDELRAQALATPVP
jgi:crotonobetainyl-CoA:carnitine CoA-transferase CaiB-like acyl-CoA transferase